MAATTLRAPVLKPALRIKELESHLELTRARIYELEKRELDTRGIADLERQVRTLQAQLLEHQNKLSESRRALDLALDRG